MFDEKTIRAERLFRIEAAVRHLVLELDREARHGVSQPYLVALLCTDRADRAGEKRLIGLMSRSITGRLCGDRRKFSDFFETRRRQLSARIAVDAGRIDEKIARDIGVESFCRVRHGLCNPHQHRIRPSERFDVARAELKVSLDPLLTHVGVKDPLHNLQVHTPASEMRMRKGDLDQDSSLRVMNDINEICQMNFSLSLTRSKTFR